MSKAIDSESIASREENDSTGFRIHLHKCKVAGTKKYQPKSPQNHQLTDNFENSLQEKAN